jgi:hypothetical protein
MAEQRGPFERFVDSPYYSESELCGGAVTVSFSKYLTWRAMHFLQLFTHFSKTKYNETFMLYVGNWSNTRSSSS